MRFQAPRLLKAKETADSLEHWKNMFEVYITRDVHMAPFLTLNWNPADINMGQAAREGVTVEQMGANCRLFLNHVCSFFEYPYYNKRIQTRSTSLISIYAILEDIYQVEKTADSFLSLAKVSKTSAESYSVFYAKILYLMEQNLAPPNITVDHVTTGEQGDKLTVTLMDTAAMLWLMKIDSRLMDKVEVEFAVAIKAGKRLSDLVPQISKAIPNLLKKMDGFKSQVVDCIKDLSLEEEFEDEESENTKVLRIDTNRGARGGKRGYQRGGQGFQGGASRSKQVQKSKQVCQHYSH